MFECVHEAVRLGRRANTTTRRRKDRNAFFFSYFNACTGAAAAQVNSRFALRESHAYASYTLVVTHTRGVHDVRLYLRCASALALGR